jgi:hypothetical protein
MLLFGIYVNGFITRPVLPEGWILPGFLFQFPHQSGLGNQGAQPFFPTSLRKVGKKHLGKK